MKKKTVIVAGASRGIGLTISKKYISQNYETILLSRTRPNLKLTENFQWYCVDLTNEKKVKSVINKILKKNKKIDILINNIGISEWKPITKIDKKFLDKMFHTNLYSIFFLIKEIAKHFKKFKSGNIVNISSIAGKRGTKNNSVYCATKFGLNGLTQSICKELGQYNIRVNAVCPVLIKTPGLLKEINSKYSPAFKDKNFFSNFANSNSALNSLPTAEDVADMVFFLTSNESASITGQSINVDCGVLPQ